jgi:hypothetical protein
MKWKFVVEGHTVPEPILEKMAEFSVTLNKVRLKMRKWHRSHTVMDLAYVELSCAEDDIWQEARELLNAWNSFAPKSQTLVLVATTVRGNYKVLPPEEKRGAFTALEALANARQYG